MNSSCQWSCVALAGCTTTTAATTPTTTTTVAPTTSMCVYPEKFSSCVKCDKYCHLNKHGYEKICKQNSSCTSGTIFFNMGMIVAIFLSVQHYCTHFNWYLFKSNLLPTVISGCDCGEGYHRNGTYCIPTNQCACWDDVNNMTRNVIIINIKYFIQTLSFYIKNKSLVHIDTTYSCTYHSIIYIYISHVSSYIHSFVYIVVIVADPYWIHLFFQANERWTVSRCETCTCAMNTINCTKTSFSCAPVSWHTSNLS